MPRKNTSTIHSLKNSKEKSSALHWLDNNILLILSGFLLAFIPLYPKIPLAELIPGYIVRLRLEDIFVLIATVIYAIQVLRKKAEWKTPFTWLISGYALVGLLSTFSAVFITKTVPAELIHVGKTLLHYFRYLEYFSLFFLFFSAVKTRKDLLKLLTVFALTVIAVALYGFGQKFYYWPVYSTMNREFSKGLRLYLTEHARVQSTFGGHYDLAGYLVIALPLLAAFFFSIQKMIYKLPIAIAYLLGLWLIIVSASRTSFAGFVIGLSVVLALIALSKKNLREKIRWGFSRSFVMYVIILYMFFSFGDSIFDRFLQTISAYPALIDTYDNLNDKRKLLVSGDLSELISSSMPKPQKPENAISVEELSNALTESDTQPEPQRPADVYVDVPDIIYITTTSAQGTASVERREVDRTWSANAQKYGLSLAIRLDTLWPRAIQGFQRNPILGSGYATLTKDQVIQFTEAESTDNNYLRTLGETGLLGFLTFYGVVGLAIAIAIKVMYQTKIAFNRHMAIGFIGATVGLLLNAIYIDVFAASKIAFTYWALTGCLMAYFLKSEVIHKTHTSNETSS